jgi:hypothetical protein
VVQVEVDVMQGPAKRRRVAVYVAQENDGADETNEIGDETDETDRNRRDRRDRRDRRPLLRSA